MGRLQEDTSDFCIKTDQDIHVRLDFRKSELANHHHKIFSH